MSRKLSVYFSLISPWAYIGHGEMLRIAEQYGLDIDYRPVSLTKLFPESGGLPLPKRHESRQNYRLIELQRWRDKRGLDFSLHPHFWPFDANLADQTICALQAGGRSAGPFVGNAFRAVFEQQRNLAELAVVEQVLTESGLPAEWAQRGEQAGAAYQANLAQALAAGVFGSPSYVLDGEIFWGQDRLELLEDALACGRTAYSCAV